MNRKGCGKIPAGKLRKKSFIFSLKFHSKKLQFNDFHFELRKLIGEKNIQKFVPWKLGVLWICATKAQKSRRACKILPLKCESHSTERIFIKKAYVTLFCFTFFCSKLLCSQFFFTFFTHGVKSDQTWWATKICIMQLINKYLNKLVNKTFSDQICIFINFAFLKSEIVANIDMWSRLSKVMLVEVLIFLCKFRVPLINTGFRVSRKLRN